MVLVAWAQLALIAHAIVHANAPTRLIVSSFSGTAGEREPRCEANRASEGEFSSHFGLKALFLTVFSGSNVRGESDRRRPALK